MSRDVASVVCMAGQCIEILKECRLLCEGKWCDGYTMVE